VNYADIKELKLAYKKPKKLIARPFLFEININSACSKIFSLLEFHDKLFFLEI
jgi:hypothetical protein